MKQQHDINFEEDSEKIRVPNGIWTHEPPSSSRMLHPLLQGSRHCFLPWLIDVYTFSVLSPLFLLVDKHRKTFLVARSDTPCLVPTPHYSACPERFGNVVQAKRCFPPVRLGYIIDVIWLRKTRQRYSSLGSQTFNTWMDYSIRFLEPVKWSRMFISSQKTKRKKPSGNKSTNR